MKIYQCLIPLLIILVQFDSCKKEVAITDTCSKTVKGYVVGIDQCSNKGFVLTILNPADTLVTYNLPDSLYHFPKDVNSDIYNNRTFDFLFPSAYLNKYPITYSYDVASPDQEIFPLCAGNVFTGHYTGTIGLHGKQIIIKCATKN